MTRILLLHNAYQQRGGEDAVVEQEFRLLQEAGHDVHLEIVSNDQISGALTKIRTFLSTPYNTERKKWIADLLARLKPDLVHIHNFFPLLTPAVHDAASDAGVAVVQTLHNYRTICASATLLRNGAVCEKCLGGNRNWGIVHRCYRGSLPASIAVVRMQNRAFRSGIWSDKVHRFIALTELGRAKFVSSGLPADRIAVKPNFARDASTPAVDRRGVLFVGRLSVEKGARVLLDAWRENPPAQLTFIGEGPEEAELRSLATTNISFLGSMAPAAVRDHMARAQLLIMPSIWQEPFGLVICEAFAAGLPVLGSRLGAMQELIEPGKTGDLFDVGDAGDLAAKARSLLSDPASLEQMGRNARRRYEERYTPEVNLRMLETIYAEALELAASKGRPQST